MTLSRVPFYTGATPDGAPQHPADLVRQAVDFVGNGAGAFNHLVPRADNGQLLIGFGGMTIQGKAQQWQGGYRGWNSGDHVVDFVGNTSSSPRHDLVVIRVEDPSFEGSRNVMTDPILFSEQITNVPPGTRTLAEAGKPGYSAIPIMRVDWPPSTTVPIQDYVRDARELANPREHTVERIVDIEEADWSDDLNSATFERWPGSAVYNGFNVDVPPWAVRANVFMQFASVRAFQGNVIGHVRGEFGQTVTGGNYYNFDISSTRQDTATVTVHDAINVPADHRGTTRDLWFQGNRSTASDTGARLEAKSGSSLYMRIRFVEDPEAAPELG